MGCLTRVPWLLFQLLQLQVHRVRGWWCETSNRTGCRGRPRQFVQFATPNGPPPVDQIRIAALDDPMVVDWDNDGDLDVVVSTLTGMQLFELKSGAYVAAKPNPFEGIISSACRPAFVDWNGDGFYDVLIGTQDGIRYYEMRGGELQELTGFHNPFQGIGAGGSGCSNPAVADLDGDGDLDLLIGCWRQNMTYFEQTAEGRFTASPLADIPSNSETPMLVDWDGDGRVDVLSLQGKDVRMRTELLNQFSGTLSCCPVDVYLQKHAGNFTHVSLRGPLTAGLGCRNFGCQGLSLVDVDGDHDLDAVFAQHDGPLHIFEHKAIPGINYHYLAEPSVPASDSDSIPIDRLRLQPDGQPDKDRRWTNWVHPVLADWDLDGDLDLALLDQNHPEQSRFFEHLADNRVRELEGVPLPNISCPIDLRGGFSMVDANGDGRPDLLGFRGVDFMGQKVWREVACFHNMSDNVSDFVLTDTFFSFINPSLGYSGPFLYTGHPVFVDWDSDGDVDFLRIDTDNDYRVLLKEQLPDGIWDKSRPLPGVPIARDFTAADFDGDGDVDLMITVKNEERCRYFERRADGSLEELVGSENPFETACGVTGTSVMSDKLKMTTTLGDWDGDGDVDLLRVDPEMVTLWINSPMNDFQEFSGKNNPFPDDALDSDVSLVDVDADGDFDMVLTHQVLSDFHWKYHEHMEDGKLVSNESNPFVGVPDWNDWLDMLFGLGSHTTVADVDGDGDLDVVSRNLEYAEQHADGRFVLREGLENPFRKVEHNLQDCWMLIDWDADGDQDLVQAFLPDINERVMDLINFSFQPDFQPFIPALRMRLYKQVNGSFAEVTGPESPFDSMATKDLPSNSACPAMADLDNDGDLDLLLVDGDRSLFYFEQQEGHFILAMPGPFADVHIQADFSTKSDPPQVWLVDWDGDSLTDLIVRGRARTQYFRRGACSPLPPYSFCMFGLCNQRTSQCSCQPGAIGTECSMCSMHHFRGEDMCQACPGHETIAGVCSRRGECDDDAAARERSAAKNLMGFKVISARGSGQCNCSSPFNGTGCKVGSCPPGHRPYLDAQSPLRSDKHPVLAAGCGSAALGCRLQCRSCLHRYPVWESCVPCQPGRYKSSPGNHDCSYCGADRIPATDNTSCVPCEAGTRPEQHRPGRLQQCIDCENGTVAEPGSMVCTGCTEGTSPNKERSACVACEAGKYALARATQCQPCNPGEVPDPASRNRCIKCTGRTYAREGDDACQVCSFPAMTLGKGTECTVWYTLAFGMAFLVLLLILLAVFGRLRLGCLRSQLVSIIKAKSWQELHELQIRRLEYGLWTGSAHRLLADHRKEVKEQSCMLGISLWYVFTQLKQVYKTKAEEAEWREDGGFPVTRSGYFVKVRNCRIQVDDEEAAWNDLPTCDAPENPNFHQVAGLLTYGPLALGKDLRCPRDGRVDCSVVDALSAESNSGRATWFMSWAWGYEFETVLKALARWWDKHKVVTALTAGQTGDESDSGAGVYIWWCVFVNNQFRMLEEGLTEEPEDLFEVFGGRLTDIGRMLMCMDKLQDGIYTSRIWCIFEIFVACQRSIPATVILPEFQVDAVHTWQDLTKVCRVDAKRASASFKADEDMIKNHIEKMHKSFKYVNETVENALYGEVLRYLEGQAPAPTHAEAGATGATALSERSSDLELSAFESSDTMKLQRTRGSGGCNIQ